MKVDLALRHKLFGSQGSLWERQTDAPTKQRIRAIVAEAGNAPQLADLDRLASTAAGQRQMLVEDVFFRFADGNFAVIGSRQSEYDRHRVQLPSGERLHIAYKTDGGTYSSSPLTIELAQVIRDFLLRVAADEDLFLSDQSRDWYLVPVPRDILPLVIRGKEAGVYLVQGIDFQAYEGYIAMADPPAAVLPSGMVQVHSAYRLVPSVNSFVASKPTNRYTNKWVAVYARQSNSVAACRRAAAEYAGMYVTPDYDIVLDVTELEGHRRVYSFAKAGAIYIDYPHAPLKKGESLSPGHVVCLRFDLVVPRQGDTENRLKLATEGWDAPLVLDGVLPVNGLTWNGHTPVRLENGGVDPITSGQHTRLVFDGEEGTLSRFWEVSRLHETSTGNFLHADLGAPALPSTVDFWDLLEDFYGPQLLLALAEDHGPAINSRLWRFLVEHHPKSCNMLLSIRLNPPFDIRFGQAGEPLVDEFGSYVPLAPMDPCTTYLLSVNGHIITSEGQPLTITNCD